MLISPVVVLAPSLIIIKEAITIAGLIAEINLTDGFAIQPELLYSTQVLAMKMQEKNLK
jgi:hypothetical protein